MTEPQTEIDLGVVDDDVARPRRRGAVVLGVALAATGLVAGTLVGMAIERDRQPTTAAATAPEGDGAGGASDDSTTSGGGDGDDFDAADGDADLPAASFGATDEATPSRGGAGLGDYGMDLEWIGSATSGGLTIRLLEASYGSYGGGNPLWEPAPGCFAIGSWSVQVSGERFVSHVGVERFQRPGVPDGTVQVVGVGEGSPHWVVVAAVDAAGATVTFPDGSTGPATAIGGVAVAATAAPGWASASEGDEHGWTATIDGPAGQFDIHSWWYPGEDFYRDNCEPPPPALPEPGDQPDDPDQSTDEVIAALSTVFGGGPESDRLDLVQHPDVVIPALEQLAANYPDLVATAVFRDLVFTAPDTAFFLWDLETSMISFTDQIGEARRIDGRWVLTTETVCVQLRRGGAPCEAPDA